MSDLDALLAEVRACRVCPLPQTPKPILQAGEGARVAIFSQAPGNLADKGGKPFMDPSGVRLRDWLGLGEEIFYDREKLAIVPMGFCFPGYDAKGGDLPPRTECAPLWRERVLERLPDLKVAVLVGGYAQKWHLGAARGRTLTETVTRWREYGPFYTPIVHPSWRNNAWLKRNPWFEAELVPELRARVRRALER